MSWTPLPGWLLVRPVETEEQFGSLVIPDSVRGDWTRTQFEVEASGGALPQDPDEDPETPGEIGAGDWVLIPQRLAFQVIEEEVMFASERNVWAVITEV